MELKRRIRRLPAEVIGRIAAGEMIARPSAALKELIENSLDAGAQRVSVRILESLDRFLEIADDGTGIGRDDLAFALERYTTSKIAGEEDLLGIETLGFRGEALAAIAEISRITVVSRVEDSADAWKIRAEGGRIGELEAAARARGTTATVEDLFYNTPVRKRFLKKGPAELRLAREIVEAYAQAFPGLAWKLALDDRVLLDLSPAPDLRARLAQIHGARLAEQLLAVEAREGERLGLHGFVGSPELARAGSRHQTLFVNGRWVVSPWLFQAVRQAFGDLIPSHQSPWAVLLLTVPPDELDVNLHPTKREVRFLDDRAVFGFVQRAVRPAVARMLPRLFLPDPRQEAGQHAATEGETRPYGGPHSYSHAHLRAGPHGSPHTPGDLAERLYGDPGADSVRESALPSAAFAGALSAQPSFAGGSGEGAFPAAAHAPQAGSLGDFPSGTSDGLVSLWQLHARYVLAQTRKGLFIIDQHAAHERILYERIRARMLSQETAAQQLLFPAILEIDPAEMELYREQRSLLARMGFECEEIDARTLVVRGVPPLWRARTEASLLRDLLAEAGSMGLREGETAEGLARAFACQAAIKAGEPLTVEEMNRLTDELFATQVPHGDPHGRPTFVFLSLDDLDRRFGRAGGG